MIAAASKALFHALAQVAALQRIASRYGMSPGGGFARRFIAGESIEEAVEAVRPLAGRGLLLTLDYLGESVGSWADAEAATTEYRRLLDVIVRSGIERNVSLKLTQIGLGVDRLTCVDNMRRILDPAKRHGFFVRVDMEGSAHTEATLETIETLWGLGFRNIGAVLQSCLLRSEKDLERVAALGMRVRVVKGAYREPAGVAHQQKRDVDDAFVRLMQQALETTPYPAIATHDPAMIDATRQYAAARGHAADGFEFQMLYGIRRDLQAALVADGYRVRLYVPFGRQWFPYFMRRLGERPANVGFVLKGLLGEGRDLSPAAS